MKRVFKSRIFAFILGAVIFGGIGVLASNLLASQVTYNNTTVDQALNYLYNKVENPDCVSGKIVCTACNTDEGQEVLDFVPSVFATRWINDTQEVVHYYNSELSETDIYAWTKLNNSNTYTANILTTGLNKYIKDSKFYFHNFGSGWVNQDVYYMACR